MKYLYTRIKKVKGQALDFTIRTIAFYQGHCSLWQNIVKLTDQFTTSSSTRPCFVATSKVPCTYFSLCCEASKPSSSSLSLTLMGTIKLINLKMRNDTIKLYPTAHAMAFNWVTKKLKLPLAQPLLPAVFTATVANIPVINMPTMPPIP